MKRFIFVILIILSLLCGCSIGKQDPTEISTIPETEPHIVSEPGSYMETYTDPETSASLDYYIHFPNNATADMPLLVFLHGDGEVAQPWLLENYGPIQAAREIYGEDFPFIALFPCTKTHSWTSGSIPGRLIGLITYIAEEYQVDRDKIILTGHSRGAMGAWNMLSKYGDYFSCAVPVSCGPGTLLDYEAIAQVPIRAVVGTVGDLEVNYSQAMQRTVDALIEVGGEAELLIMKGQTHQQTSTAAYTKETFEWMLEQSKENSR